MTELDKQMDKMLIEIKYLKSDKYVNGIKADGIDEAIKNNNTGKCESSYVYYCLLKDYVKKLRG